MALGIYTIRPKDSHEIIPTIRLYNPHKSVSTPNEVIPPHPDKEPYYKGSRDLARYILDKNIKGSADRWAREYIGEVYELGDWQQTGFARVVKPGRIRDGWPVGWHHEPVYVPTYEEIKDVRTFCKEAISHAAFAAVNGMPDAHITYHKEFERAVDIRDTAIAEWHDSFRTLPHNP